MRIKSKNNEIYIGGSSLRHKPSKVLRSLIALLKKETPKSLSLCFDLEYVNESDRKSLVELIRELNARIRKGMKIYMKWFISDNEEITDVGIDLQGQVDFECDLIRNYPHKVLIVDPSVIVREILTMMYHRENVSMDYADNGRIAMNYLRSEKNYNLVATELSLDYFSGWEIAAYLSREEYAHIPLIIMSDQHSIEEAKKLCHRENVSFMPKPLDPIKLKNHIEEVLKMNYHGRLVA